jgi:hypothetical protein
MKIVLTGLLIAQFAFAQEKTAPSENFDAAAEERMDTEFEAFEDLEENPVQSNTSEEFEAEPTPTTVPQRKAVVGGDVVRENRYPEIEERFVKPARPSDGKSVRVPHPDASKGLLRINKDGTYQYRVSLKEKTRSASLRVGTMTAPIITGGTAGVNYETMYDNTPLSGANFEYEWQPFRKFGRVGLNLGFGLAMNKASGFLAATLNRSEEEYSLFVLPLSANLVYRFEYGRRQYVVPYIVGGGSYYALYENRDDNRKKNFAGAAAIGGGAGILITLSKWDAKSAFTLSEEYDVADLWLSIEARALKGLKQDIDFTGQTIYVGITADY